MTSFELAGVWPPLLRLPDCQSKHNQGRFRSELKYKPREIPISLRGRFEVSDNNGTIVALGRGTITLRTFSPLQYIGRPRHGLRRFLCRFGQAYSGLDEDPMSSRC